MPSCEVAESVKNSAIKYLMLLYMECLSKEWIVFKQNEFLKLKQNKVNFYINKPNIGIHRK
jgi:hypothetical protein